MKILTLKAEFFPWDRRTDRDDVDNSYIFFCSVAKVPKSKNLFPVPCPGKGPLPLHWPALPIAVAFISPRSHRAIRYQAHSFQLPPTSSQKTTYQHSTAACAVTTLRNTHNSVFAGPAISWLTFWRQNYFLNFSTPCIQNMNNTGTKYVRIMKQTAFWREKKGDSIPCLKYSVPIFVE